MLRIKMLSFLQVRPQFWERNQNFIWLIIAGVPALFSAILGILLFRAYVNLPKNCALINAQSDSANKTLCTLQAHNLINGHICDSMNNEHHDKCHNQVFCDLHNENLHWKCTNAQKHIENVNGNEFQIVETGHYKVTVEIPLVRRLNSTENYGFSIEINEKVYADCFICRRDCFNPKKRHCQVITEDVRLCLKNCVRTIVRFQSYEDNKVAALPLTAGDNVIIKFGREGYIIENDEPIIKFEKIS